jgi:hypothetical protein
MEEVPLRVAVSSEEPEAVDSVSTGTMLNITAAGLALAVLHPVAVGAQLTISMPEIWPDYKACGTVAWCSEAGQGFEAGVLFGHSNEAFKARMVAQFCQIEDYRREMRDSEGRLLSSEEAAREWIVQFAEDFRERTLDWQ